MDIALLSEGGKSVCTLILERRFVFVLEIVGGERRSSTKLDKLEPDACSPAAGADISLKLMEGQ